MLHLHEHAVGELQASKLPWSLTGQPQLHDLEQALAGVSDEAVLVAEQLLQAVHRCHSRSVYRTADTWHT